MTRHRMRIAAITAVLILSSNVSAELCFQWVDRTRPPGAAGNTIMAYDSARQVLVIFGGSYHPNTWEWNGENLELRSESTPSFDSNFTEAVFDEDNQRIIVYEGWSIGQTWSWNGTEWALLSSAGPGLRRAFDMVYDTDRDVVVLHGGRHISQNNVYYNDTWEWNGAEWLLVSSNGPVRGEHAMAFDSARGVTVLHGGREVSSTYARNTWEWNGIHWNQVSSDSGPIIDGGEMVFDSLRNLVVTFYPPSSSASYDEWMWDGVAWTSNSAPGIRSYFDPDLVFDATRNVVVTYSGGLWDWDGSQWHYMGGGAPSGPVVYDRVIGRALAAERVGNLTRVWERLGDKWRPIDLSGPFVGTDFAIAHDSARSVLVLFGGRDTAPNPDVYYGETWEWSNGTWTLAATSGPSPRSGIRMAYDDARGVMVLFGGFNGTNLGDTWEWDGEQWSEVATTGPSPRFWYGLTYDIQRQVTVLMGGAFYNGFTIESIGTWEWDGMTWTQRSTTFPPPRYLPVFGYDELRNVSVLMGGYKIGPVDAPMAVPGTYEWDGAQWVQRTSTDFMVGSTVYDPSIERMILYSGYRVWEYPRFLLPSDQPDPEFFPTSTIPTQKNRYLSFFPPPLPDGATSFAFRVTATQLPGPADCPNVGDFSDRFTSEMWVGDEVLQGTSPTGLHNLSTTPVFRDWSSVPGGVIHVSDCNIVPCATYAVEAVTDTPCNIGQPMLISEPAYIATSPVWADIVANDGSPLPDGVVDFVDISASVDRFRNIPTSPPGTWCDLGGDSPYQGVLFNIDFTDISLVVDAFRGRPYPFPGPTAPNPCP